MLLVLRLASAAAHSTAHPATACAGRSRCAWSGAAAWGRFAGIRSGAGLPARCQRTCAAGAACTGA